MKNIKPIYCHPDKELRLIPVFDNNLATMDSAVFKIMCQDCFEIEQHKDTRFSRWEDYQIYDK
jgi:hypothetical protein